MRQPLVGPSGFGPKRTSVLSGSVAHGPPSSIEHRKFWSESKTIGRWPCQYNRINLIVSDELHSSPQSNSHLSPSRSPCYPQRVLGLIMVFSDYCPCRSYLEISDRKNEGKSRKITHKTNAHQWNREENQNSRGSRPDSPHSLSGSWCLNSPIRRERKTRESHIPPVWLSGWYMKLRFSCSKPINRVFGTPEIRIFCRADGCFRLFSQERTLHVSGK